MQQEQVGNTDLIKITEVAALLKVTEQTARAWAKEGRIPQPVPWAKSPQFWKKDEVLDYVGK